MKTTTSFFTALLLLLALSAAPNDARAQAVIEVGPRVGYEIDDFEALTIGADVRVSTVTLPFQVNGTFDYYFADELAGTDLNVFQITGNALYEFGINNQLFTPYAGPGLSITRVSFDSALPDDSDFSASDTDLGLNLVGGAEFGVRNLKAFAQASFVVGGSFEPVNITGGVLFGIGGQ